MTIDNLTQIVYAWPDTTWRYDNEYDEIIDMWKGNDYVVLTFPVTASYEEIEECVIEYFGGV